MKLRAWGIAALALCVLAAGAAPGQAQVRQDRSVLKGPSSDAGVADEDVDLASYQSVSFGGGTGGGVGMGYGGGSSGGGGFMDRPIQIVGGAEYLYARANFSEAPAYVLQDVNNAIDTFVQYDFDYESSYSFFGGIYMCDCGGSILFDYTRLTSESSYTADETTGVLNVWGQYEVNGDQQGFADVDLQSYDLSFSKTIPLGCPMQGDCCGDTCCDDACCGDTCCDDACGNGCGGGCPAWDITWTGGIRFADVNWNRGATELTSTPTSYRTTMDFEGFGGRVGLAGRRYFGKKGLVSLYAKGDWSLLVGDITVVTAITNPADVAQIRTSCDHIVPVTEIELGGTVHVTNNASVSAGYFWSAWHDLGMRDVNEYNGRFQTSHYDDANILGFDGLFVRGEVAF